MKNELNSQISSNKFHSESPLIIELSGTPNSGKTTTLLSLSTLLKQKGIAHTLLFESAADCPVKDKLSPDYNYWTGCNTIQKLLQAAKDECSLILCERGIFDAFTWLYFHYQHNKISRNEFLSIQNLYLMSQAHFPNSHVLVLKCCPAVSIHRDSIWDPDYHYGTIINPVILDRINRSIEECMLHYSSCFQSIQQLDTSNLAMEDVITFACDHILLKNIQLPQLV